MNHEDEMYQRQMVKATLRAIVLSSDNPIVRLERLAAEINSTFESLLYKEEKKEENYSMRQIFHISFVELWQEFGENLDTVPDLS